MFINLEMKVYSETPILHSSFLCHIILCIFCRVLAKCLYEEFQTLVELMSPQLHAFPEFALPFPSPEYKNSTHFTFHRFLTVCPTIFANIIKKGEHLSTSHATPPPHTHTHTHTHYHRCPSTKRQTI
jgi:hypothetical protein